jgi:hypothetical protein
MLSWIFLPEPSTEYVWVKTDRIRNSERWYLSSCCHFVNLLGRDSEDPCNITNSKCLVFCFNHFNQFHEYPLCLLGGESIERQPSSDAWPIVVRTENSVKRHRLLSTGPPLTTYAHAM